jgi:transcriptional regulator with XRE-family HTH domain
MYAVAMGRVLRMLRLRRDWRQSDVAEKAGISSSAVGRHESGVIGSLRSLEQHAAVFGLRVDVRVLGRAGSLMRLGDEEHARIAETVAAWFREHRFVTETEASFSEWGERGRIDLLAFDPLSGTLVIVEAKTQLLDLQDLFGSLNVKERLAATIAERRGWKVDRCVTLLAVAQTAANRTAVREHPSSFADFDTRRLTIAGLRLGRRLIHWVRADGDAGSWLAGRQRVSRQRLTRVRVSRQRAISHPGGLARRDSPETASSGGQLPSAEQ